MRAWPAILLCVLVGCACMVPDWHSRPSGKMKFSPEFLVWTAPRWEGVADRPVTIFARMNNKPEWKDAGLSILWESNHVELPPMADQSWSFRTKLPAGRHSFVVRLVLKGEAVVSKDVTLHLYDSINKGPGSWWEGR